MAIRDMQSQALQNAASAIGNGTTVDLEGYPVDSVVYARWSANVDAGQLVIETSDDSSFAGTWAPLATLTISAGVGSGKIDVVQIQGVLRYIRARIATVVNGGNVTATLIWRWPPHSAPLTA